MPEVVIRRGRAGDAAPLNDFGQVGPKPCPYWHVLWMEREL
jgi:hypothetical protein